MRQLSCPLLPSAVALMLVCGPVFSQAAGSAYPTRPVTVIVPFAAGGPADLEARIYAKKMGELTGQRIVTDYKPGANSTIGASFVARAPADGYTLLVGTAGLPLMPTQYPKLPFNILKDFAPISQMSERTSVLLSSPSFPAKNFREYVAYAKKNPGKVTYGFSSGSSHLVGAWLHNLSDIKVTFVGYKGVGPASADLMANRLDLLSSTLAVSLGLMKSGKANGLAILGTKRSRLVPDLQTVPEQGVPEFDFAGNWFGFLAPAGTPAEVINKLVDICTSMADAPDVVAQLEAQGSTAIGSKPAEFRQLIASETARWAKVVKDSNIVLGDN